MVAAPPGVAVDALIFDLDGLLVDSEPLTHLAVNALLRRHGSALALTPELVERLTGRRIPEILAVLAELGGITVPLAELNEDFEEQRLVTLRGRLRAFPGAAEVLAFGRAAGLRLGLATSSRRAYADAVLAEAGFAGRFDAEVTGEEVARGKPAPDAYLLAAARLGVAPAACVVFEDAPNGVAAAVAAGMRAVAIPAADTRAAAFAVAPAAVLPDLRAAVPWLRAQGVGSGGSPPIPAGSWGHTRRVRRLTNGRF